MCAANNVPLPLQHEWLPPTRPARSAKSVELLEDFKTIGAFPPGPAGPTCTTAPAQPGQDHLPFAAQYERALQPSRSSRVRPRLRCRCACKRPAYAELCRKSCRANARTADRLSTFRFAICPKALLGWRSDWLCGDRTQTLTRRSSAHSQRWNQHQPNRHPTLSSRDPLLAWRTLRCCLPPAYRRRNSARPRRFQLHSAPKRCKRADRWMAAACALGRPRQHSQALAQTVDLLCESRLHLPAA